MPATDGMNSAAMPMVEKIAPNCVPDQCRFWNQYAPIVSSHAPQMKYWRKFIATRRSFRFIAVPQRSRERRARPDVQQAPVPFRGRLCVGTPKRNYRTRIQIPSAANSTDAQMREARAEEDYRHVGDHHAYRRA